MFCSGVPCSVLVLLVLFWCSLFCSKSPGYSGVSGSVLFLLVLHGFSLFCSGFLGSVLVNLVLF